MLDEGSSPMKIVIAPDKFRGCLTAAQVCEAMAAGIRRADANAEIVLAPLADGGEGTVELLVQETGGKLQSVEVTGPLGQPVTAKFGLLGNGTTAILEMADASGAKLVNAHERNPLI